MCIFNRGRSTPIATPQPIQPRQPDLVQASRLPARRDLIDEEDVAAVEYGTTSTKKDDTRGTAQRTGTDALKININTGTSGSGTGGLNV